MSEQIPELYAYENNVYKTPQKRISLCARLFPTLHFYRKVISIVVSASSRSKRGKYTWEDYTRSSLDTIRGLESVGIKFEISGVENIRALDGPCVFVGNHMSTVETFVSASIVYPIKKFAFVVKQSLMDFPIFKHVMRFTEPIAVGRINPREDLTTVLKDGQAKLEAGTSVLIFPQRTRIAKFSGKEFNTIGIKLAKRANLPILPVAFKTDVWKNGKILKDFGGIDTSKNVYIKFGEPMAITGRGDEQHQKSIEFIQKNLENWGHFKELEAAEAK
jgi:1-acyl-sn-glycerol-3-phosphate acyltransferase